MVDAEEKNSSEKKEPSIREQYEEKYYKQQLKKLEESEREGKKGKSRLEKTSGELIFGPIRRLLNFIGKWIIKPFLYLLGLAIVLLAALFLWNAAKTGTIGAVWSNVVIAISNTPISKLVGVASTTITKPQTLIAQDLSWNSQVEQNTNNPTLGISIASLQTPTSTYFSGDTENPPQLIGQISGTSLDPQSDVKVLCSLGDYKGQVDYSPPEAQTGIPFYKDVTQTLTTRCTFKDGLTIPESKLSTETIATERGTFNVLYDFTTQAFLNVYTLSDAVFLTTPKPFENIQEPYLKSNNVISSVTTSGPVNLGIGLVESQPLTESRGYYFGVTVANSDVSGQGSINTLNELVVQMPEGTTLDTSKNCDFVYLGTLPQIGSTATTATVNYETYGLSNTALARMNIDCSQYGILGALSEQECIQQHKTKQTFSCNLKVKTAEPTTTFIGSIKAQAKYTYEVSKSVALNFIKKQQSVA